MTVQGALAELAALEDPKQRAANEKRGDDHGINLSRLRALAKRIVLEKQADGGLVAKGVVVQSEDGEQTIAARAEVILAAGALQSPQLLELSGIGQRAVLEKAGVPVEVDLPGVGENLQEHCIGGFNFGMSTRFLRLR